MKIYDISQEVFSCEVYPGDPRPEKTAISSICDGSLYNLTEFKMCAHNGTHIDAPFHFIDNGKTVEEIPLDKFVGFAYVASHTGIFSAEDAVNVLNKARRSLPDAAKRILIKGDAVVSQQAAEVFAREHIFLVGNESQTIGPEDAPMQVHKILLGAEVVLLEGVRLNEVDEGVYFLNSAPLALSGSDGAPCRAVLLGLDKNELRLFYGC